MASSPSPGRFTLTGLPAEDRLAVFARDMAAALTAFPKSLPCCYFYDRLGARLFEAICELPEYYLTRAEDEILRAHAEEIAALFPRSTELVELGSGSAAKTRLLIEAFLRRRTLKRYVPLDICRSALEETSSDLVRAYPTLEVFAIAGEYREALHHLSATAGSCKLILWLGSNIGNLERSEAGRFLGQIRDTLAPGDGVLIGIDLRKDSAAVEAAYDDAGGVTAAFNRNLLARINRELGGHFDLRTFQHRARYDAEVGRVEMYLVSDRRQQVAIDHLRLEVPFVAGEAIHTENSYKYSLAEIETLAATARMRCRRTWFDSERRFSLNLFTAGELAR
ncbi:MAG: L-histidine N(alpha)-methyltransferase [Planctomycetia bacterium]|nr:L-histidine N(alpha)-methyltransferase [Planctomycetia bacterium]